MGYELADALRLLAEIESLEATARAKRHTLKVALAALPDRPTVYGSEGAKWVAEKVCPRCGIEVRGKTVEEHLEDVHGKWPGA